MNTNMTQQELLDYIIKKFDLKLDFKKDQLQLFFEQFCKKIITWELVTSIIWLLVLIAVQVIIIAVLTKKNKKDKIFSYIKEYASVETFETGALDKWWRYMLLVIALGMISIGVCIPNIMINIVDIVECLAFPEKVILEFISSYISL